MLDAIDEDVLAGVLTTEEAESLRAQALEQVDARRRMSICQLPAIQQAVGFAPDACIDLEVVLHRIGKIQEAWASFSRPPR